MKAVVAVVLAAVCAGALAAAVFLNQPKPGPSPLHVADVFFDGVNHADFRQTCSVWQAGRTHMPDCEAYLVMLEATNGGGSYRVVPHSEKQWRETHVLGVRNCRQTKPNEKDCNGSVQTTEVASVKVTGPYGVKITCRLVKSLTAGWVVVAAS